MDISVWRLKRTIMMDCRTLLNISSSLVGLINQANVKTKIESISLFLYNFYQILGSEEYPYKEVLDLLANR